MKKKNHLSSDQVSSLLQEVNKLEKLALTVENHLNSIIMDQKKILEDQNIFKNANLKKLKFDKNNLLLKNNFPVLNFFSN